MPFCYLKLSKVTSMTFKHFTVRLFGKYIKVIEKNFKIKLWSKISFKFVSRKTRLIKENVVEDENSPRLRPVCATITRLLKINLPPTYALMKMAPKAAKVRSRRWSGHYSMVNYRSTQKHHYHSFLSYPPLLRCDYSYVLCHIIT